MVASIEERISKVEGIVNEHNHIFDMIRGEIRDVKVSMDNRIDDFREENYHGVGYDNTQASLS